MSAPVSPQLRSGIVPFRRPACPPLQMTREERLPHVKLAVETIVWHDLVVEAKPSRFGSMCCPAPPSPKGRPGHGR